MSFLTKLFAGSNPAILTAITILTAAYEVYKKIEETNNTVG